MDFLPFPLASLLAWAFLVLLGSVILLNIFGLPGNWVLLGLTALWKLAHPSDVQMDVWFWVMMAGFAVAGEILEFSLQIVKARKYGSSSSGTFAGMIGAIAGAILLAPLFFGLGALIGALIGAWIGCFFTEWIIRGRPVPESLLAAMGAMVGRFLGTVCKCGVGGCMLALTAGRILPRPPGFAPDAVEGARVMLNLCGFSG
ncbi:MAG: DUF456 domain-containing protein [Desulfovibrio sp.]|jgi:uncharacterized protein YqgC (DUF456 family)|nr:DUF456 domain-containing protein [Desulfovibrio sp.]